MKLVSKRNGNYVKIPVSRLSNSIRVKLGIFISVQATNLSSLFVLNEKEYLMDKEKERLIFCDDKYISVKTSSNKKICIELMNNILDFISWYPQYELVQRNRCWTDFSTYIKRKNQLEKP